MAGIYGGKIFHILAVICHVQNLPVILKGIDEHQVDIVDISQILPLNSGNSHCKYTDVQK